MSEVKIDPCENFFESIAQCLNVLRNVRMYYAMSGVKVDPNEINPIATMLDKEKVLNNVS